MKLRHRGTILSAGLAAALLSPMAAGAQGVIAPPPEGETIAPQPPTSQTVEPQAPGVPPASAQPRMQGPASVADLAEGLLDAVVNISTAQNVPSAGRGMPRLSAPDGSPLQDFFDELLREDGRNSRQVQSLGSGFVIDASGVVVTNNHVIADADEITVNFADGRALEASVLGRDPKTDIAVLKVEPEVPLTAVSFGNSEDVRIGDWVMAIGNPFGLGGSVSVGIVSARGRNINAGPYDNFIQTDAAINRGNSGGPLFDMYGRVVGINTAIISPTGGSIGIGFSIPALLAQNVVGQLREFGETRRGWLGIRLQAVTPDIAESLGLPEARGALVMGVVPNGPSDNGRIEIGDVIVGFDGRAVESSQDLPRIVAETPVGRQVTLELLRKPSLEAETEEVSVEITLGRLEDGEEMMAAAEGGEPASEDGAQEEQASPTLGLRLADMNDALREEYGLSNDLSGVVVTEVEERSAAGEKGIEPGSVIVEIGQEEVATAAEMRERLSSLRAGGQRNALMLVAAANGDLRFVVVPLD
ncbi:Do family serine endopeptidase [Aureimonas populi]|uniref:Probable periplasmic serine endoprotease DegP-like n=1 Tax=Aureimonas populi TaxID=1701758 RepID=A0ABW5CJE1_9HYPH|nr:Do family serine endopeptidase [Aureimonas populi]